MFAAIQRRFSGTAGSAASFTEKYFKKTIERLTNSSPINIAALLKDLEEDVAFVVTKKMTTKTDGKFTFFDTLKQAILKLKSEPTEQNYAELNKLFVINEATQKLGGTAIEDFQIVIQAFKQRLENSFILPQKADAKSAPAGESDSSATAASAPSPRPAAASASAVPAATTKAVEKHDDKKLDIIIYTYEKIVEEKLLTKDAANGLRGSDIPSAGKQLSRLIASQLSNTKKLQTGLKLCLALIDHNSGKYKNDKLDPHVRRLTESLNILLASLGNEEISLELIIHHIISVTCLILDVRRLGGEAEFSKGISKLWGSIVSGLGLPTVVDTKQQVLTEDEKVTIGSLKRVYFKDCKDTDYDNMLGQLEKLVCFLPLPKSTDPSNRLLALFVNKRVRLSNSFELFEKEQTSLLARTIDDDIMFCGAFFVAFDKDSAKQGQYVDVYQTFGHTVRDRIRTRCSSNERVKLFVQPIKSAYPTFGYYVPAVSEAKLITAKDAALEELGSLTNAFNDASSADGSFFKTIKAVFPKLQQFEAQKLAKLKQDLLGVKKYVEHKLNKKIIDFVIEHIESKTIDSPRKFYYALSACLINLDTNNKGDIIKALGTLHKKLAATYDQAPVGEVTKFTKLWKPTDTKSGPTKTETAASPSTLR